ncbi:MAG: metallophosphoesterase [Bacteroidota bacterium]
MTKIKIVISVIILLLIFTMYHFPWPRETNRAHPIIEIVDSLKREGEIIFLSDTQEPIWIETLWQDENKNEIARERIFKEIINEKPIKVIHLGDIVAFGYDDDDWKPIDHFLDKLIKEKIDFYPTLGNHELILFPEIGEENFMERFPFYSRTGYSINNGATEIILLNSNFSEMTTHEIVTQQEWYINKLIQLEQDSTISAIIVGCHHSPFTNSKVVEPDENVQLLFVPPFIEFQKCKLFISGHCHAFEHFKHGEKDFLVIGGGGGLQQTLYIEDEEKWNDQYINKTSKRMFHFLKYELVNDTIRVTLKMLETDFSQFDDNYKLIIPLK